jgi:hypothetical protein
MTQEELNQIYYIPILSRQYALKQSQNNEIKQIWEK